MEAFLENLVNHWYWLPIGLVILIVLVKFLPRYKIAPPDTALIISGLLRRRYKVRNMDGSASVKRFGYRIVRCAFMPDAASGSMTILFGDFKQVYINNNGDRSIKRLDQLFIINDHVGFLMAERVGIKLTVPDAVRGLQVA